jgi:hypothetical protein
MTDLTTAAALAAPADSRARRRHAPSLPTPRLSVDQPPLTARALGRRRGAGAGLAAGGLLAAARRTGYVDLDITGCMSRARLC